MVVAIWATFIAAVGVAVVTPTRACCASFDIVVEGLNVLANER